MSDRRSERTKADIHRALLKVAGRFEKDPTPTDGSFEAALEKLGMKPKRAARWKTAGVKRRGGSKKLKAVN
jgi:hypothetical protein